DAYEVRAMSDAWNARLPGLLRQAKLLPEPSAECYVLDETHTLWGLGAVYRGAHQTLIDVFLPLESSHNAEKILRNLLPHISQSSGNVVVRLRHDMAWLGSPLEQLGFSITASQVVLIRHTLAQAKRYTFKHVPASPGTIPTTNISRVIGLDDYSRQT